jgi:hypothetical protein
VVLVPCHCREPIYTLSSPAAFMRRRCMTVAALVTNPIAVASHAQSRRPFYRDASSERWSGVELFAPLGSCARPALPSRGLRNSPDELSLDAPSCTGSRICLQLAAVVSCIASLADVACPTSMRFDRAPRFSAATACRLNSPSLQRRRSTRSCTEALLAGVRAH